MKRTFVLPAKRIWWENRVHDYMHWKYMTTWLHEKNICIASQKYMTTCIKSKWIHNWSSIWFLKATWELQIKILQILFRTKVQEWHVLWYWLHIYSIRIQNTYLDAWALIFRRQVGRYEKEHSLLGRGRLLDLRCFKWSSGLKSFHTWTEIKTLR